MAWDSNCWGTSISMARRGNVDFNVDKNNTGIIPDAYRADEILQNEFKQTDKATFGDVRRYAYPNGSEDADKGNKAGGTSHYATFLLQNGAGTVYIFSKNGAGEQGKWKAGSEQKVIGNGYGPPTPIGTGSPNYKKK